MTDIRAKIEDILGEPASHVAGRHGLPKTDEIIDYAMYFTKDGKKFLVDQILQLFKETALGCLPEKKTLNLARNFGDNFDNGYNRALDEMQANINKIGEKE